MRSARETAVDLEETPIGLEARSAFEALAGEMESGPRRGPGRDDEIASTRLTTGWIGLEAGDSIDAQIGGGLVRHGIHEWLGDAWAVPNSGGSWIPHPGPASDVMHRLSLTQTAAGNSAPVVAWIGRRCRPTCWTLLPGRRVAHRLKSEETPAVAPAPSELREELLREALLIAPSDDRPDSRRWCLEQAIRSTGVDVVFADASGFTLTDTRRLQLALGARYECGRSMVTVMLLRPPAERRVRSAATTRWIVESAVRTATSGTSDSTGGWTVRLDRVRMPQSIGMEPGPRRIVARASPSWEHPGWSGSFSSLGESSITKESRPHGEFSRSGSEEQESGDVRGRGGRESKPVRIDPSSASGGGSGGAVGSKESRSEGIHDPDPGAAGGDRLPGTQRSSSSEGLLFALP
ncbi:MAG: hypothetical protein VX672_00050 [Planctomycetota bacterium]|nr:hypothetical protein [Planctomycetota bacterium]